MRQGEPVSSPLDPYGPGQYYFASGDFLGFAKAYPIALAILGNLCTLKYPEVSISVYKTDKVAVEEFLKQYRQPVATIKIIPSDTLCLLGQMVYFGFRGKSGLYISGHFGFSFMNQMEASRIRDALLKHIA